MAHGHENAVVLFPDKGQVVRVVHPRNVVHGEWTVDLCSMGIYYTLRKDGQYMMKLAGSAMEHHLKNLLKAGDFSKDTYTELRYAVTGKRPRKKKAAQ